MCRYIFFLTLVLYSIIKWRPKYVGLFYQLLLKRIAEVANSIITTKEGLG